MEASFWHDKWARNEIGFHEPEPNPLLVQWFKQLHLSTSQRIFLPLCGKTLDIGWLLAQGLQVTGAELSEVAVQQLFAQLQLTPKIDTQGSLKCYSANNIQIFVGDIFQLTMEILGQVDAVYDRAALVALPESTRRQYSQHLIALSAAAPQLLICFEYDQNTMPGPPFSITADEVKAHYQTTFTLKLLHRSEVAGGLKGKLPAMESVWLLTPKPAP